MFIKQNIESEIKSKLSITSETDRKLINKMSESNTVTPASSDSAGKYISDYKNTHEKPNLDYLYQ